MQVLPHTIEQFRQSLAAHLPEVVDGSRWHELEFPAHEKGCTPLKRLLGDYPHWNGFKSIPKHKQHGYRYVVDPITLTARCVSKQHDGELVFRLSDWMVKFLAGYKGFLFRPDYSELIPYSTYSWDSGWGKSTRDGGTTYYNVGYHKYNKLNAADCLAILKRIERGEDPLPLPSPFLTARLLKRPNDDQSFKHLVDRRLIRVYPAELYSHDPRSYVPVDQRLESALTRQGGEFVLNPLTEDPYLKHFKYDQAGPKRGTRIVFDTPGIQQLLNWLPDAIGDIRCIEPPNRYMPITFWATKGVMLIDAEPEIVAQLLNVELSAPEALDIAARPTLPSLEDFYGLTSLERALQQKDYSRFVAQTRKGTIYWCFDFGQDRGIDILRWEKTEAFWQESRWGTSSHYLSNVTESSSFFEDLEALSWKAVVSSWKLPHRFAVPMQVTLDLGDKIFLVMEPDTGFCYEALPAEGQKPWMQGTIEGQEGRFEFTPQV